MGFFGDLKTTVQYVAWIVFFLSLGLQLLSLTHLFSGLLLISQGRVRDGFDSIGMHMSDNYWLVRLGFLSMLLAWLVVPILSMLDCLSGCFCMARTPGAVVVVAGEGRAGSSAARGRSSSVVAKRR